MTSKAYAVGLTVRDLAKLFRVSPDKVRAWIKKGQLPAVNTANVKCGKPRYVILPHQLVEFEERLQVAPLTPKATRRQKPKTKTDYYPD